VFAISHLDSVVVSLFIGRILPRQMRTNPY